MKVKPMLSGAGFSASAQCVLQRWVASICREEPPMKLRLPDKDKRLGVPRGILWGLALSVVLWALIRWLLGAAIVVLSGL